MYINELDYRNIGPIDQLNLTFRRNENGVPVPAVFVGKNGSGKSILLSNIVDAFYEIANEEYHNVTHENGRGHQYYKKIAKAQIKLGQSYMTAYIRLEHQENKYEYIFKSGKITFEEFQKMMKDAPDKALDWQEEENCKKFVGNKKAISELFESGIVCFFRPDRYAKPSWMGDKYDVPDEQIEYSANTKYTHQLDNSITASNDPKETLQWLFDVITDSRADLEKKDEGGYHIVYPNTTVLDLLSISRANAEKLMSTILGEDVIFQMSNRSSRGRRFQICRRDGRTELVPSLDALSTGQLALFNLFATVIRYADNDDIDLSHQLGEIEGVVVIDEIELHLHAELQRKVLPKLIALFPKVQFIMTSHSPLFLLGMREEFGEDHFDIYEMPLGRKISVEQFSEFENAYQYLAETNRHQTEIAQEIEKRQDKPLIITEGATDWKHMKAAYQALLSDSRCADWLSTLEFEFLEYEPKTGDSGDANGVIKLEMSDSHLQAMCKQHQLIPQPRKLLFIADRDKDDVRKDMCGQGRYKIRGNNVYSLCIPVPSHREKAPKICIEHLYLDEELKRKVVLSDGTERRIFMGNEFSETGVLIDGRGFHCTDINCCGPQSIGIIDGSGKRKVYKVDDADEKNCALTKMDFARIRRDSGSPGWRRIWV